MNRLGDIQLFAEIKRSDCCTSYRGFDLERQEKLLVKTFNRSQTEAPRSPADAHRENLAKAEQRFQNEAAIYAAMDHPNVVHLIRHGVQDGVRFIALEFIEGLSLRELLESAVPLPVDVALIVARDVLAGLAALHEEGVTHRDLKPENVMLGHEGAVKICDFDLAATVSTQTARISGTAGYLSPEMILGQEVSPRSDLFSLGVMLYEMLSGARPFRAASFSAEAGAAVRDPHLPLSRFRPDVPPALESLIDALLSKKAQDRPASARVVLNELEHHSSFPPRESRRDTLKGFIAQPSDHEAASWVQHSTPRPEAPPPMRRKRFAPSIAFAAIIVALFLWQAFWPSPETEILPDQERITALADSEDSTRIEKSLNGVEKNRSDAAGRPRHDSIGTAPPDSPRKRGVSTEQDRFSTPSPSLLPEKKTTTRIEKAAAIETKSDDQNAASGLRRVFVHCSPWAAFTIDGDSAGVVPRQTPFLLAYGKRELTFKNRKFPALSFSVEINGDTPDTLSFSLWRYVAVVELNITPWAEVFVDGEPYAYSPEDRKIILKPGAHLLRFVHPGLGEKDEAISVRAGEEKSIVVNMFK